MWNLRKDSEKDSGGHMEFISHRINTIEALKNTPFEFGVELDLRDFGNEIILSHDPYVMGERFEDYLKIYKHGTLILNVKSERIEHQVLQMIQNAGVKDYFFLDSSFPMIYLLSQLGEENTAIRLSEFEGMDTLRHMKGKAKWVWVDCFTRFILTRDIMNELHELGYKICLVSPELQGRPEDIERHAEVICEIGILPDAICTKEYQIEKWKNLLKIL